MEAFQSPEARGGVESLRSTVCQPPTSERGGGSAWGGSAPMSPTWWAEPQAGPCPGSEGECASVGQKGKLSQERPPRPGGCPQQHPAALRFTWHGLQKRRLFSG